MSEHSLPIPILFEDQDIIAVNKPSGLLVHAYKKETNERVHLMSLLKQQTGYYLYPIHRLDRPVSGIVIFGKNPDIVREMKMVWHSNATIKRYIALVKGSLTNSGVFDFPLMNEEKTKQNAVTKYMPLSWFSDSTLVSIEIETGRKHQIRRHFSRRCHNIIGDKKYGQGKINRHYRDTFGLDRIFLHACYFKIALPGGNQVIEISSPLPDTLHALLSHLKQSDDNRKGTYNHSIT